MKWVFCDWKEYFIIIIYKFSFSQSFIALVLYWYSVTGSGPTAQYTIIPVQLTWRPFPALRLSSWRLKSLLLVQYGCANYVHCAIIMLFYLFYVNFILCYNKYTILWVIVCTYFNWYAHTIDLFKIHLLISSSASRIWCINSINEIDVKHIAKVLMTQ